MTRRALLATAGAIALVTLLAWLTLSAQRSHCEVCMDFRGSRNCATASASSVSEAARTAQNIACGPIAAGMDAGIACARTDPVAVRCQEK